jgi:hypothetical protein
MSFTNSESAERLCCLFQTKGGADLTSERGVALAAAPQLSGVGSYFRHKLSSFRGHWGYAFAFRAAFRLRFFAAFDFGLGR